MMESHFWVLICFSEMTSTKPTAALPSCCTRTRALPRAVRKHLKCWCQPAQHFSRDAVETAHRLDLCDQTFVWCLRPFALRQDLFWSSFECQGWSPAFVLHRGFLICLEGSESQGQNLIVLLGCMCALWRSGSRVSCNDHFDFLSL